VEEALVVEEDSLEALEEQQSQILIRIHLEQVHPRLLDQELKQLRQIVCLEMRTVLHLEVLVVLLLSNHLLVVDQAHNQLLDLAEET